MLTRINQMRWYSRWPVKVAVFLLALLAVCFPYPHRLVKHVIRWSDPNQLIEPDAPALQPLVEEFRELIADDPPPREILRRAEVFVYQKIPYAWDWEVWGVADYIPTVTEAIEMGREDCDGRAVVAASLLAAMGIQAEIVTDFAHVWVRTDYGEAMGPGQEQVIVATDEGLKIRPRGLLLFPRALAHGVAVFPFARTLILTVVLWILVTDWRVFWLHKLAPLVLLLSGLVTLRYAGRSYYEMMPWIQSCGAGLLLAGVLWAMIAARRYRCEVVPPAYHGDTQLPTDKVGV